MSLSESLSGDLPEFIPQPQSPPQPQSRFAPPPDMTERIIQALDGLFFVQKSEQVPQGRLSVIMLRGKLLDDAEKLYPIISERLKELGYTPTMQRDGQTDVILAMEGLLVARRFSTPGWVHGLLLVATVLTTAFSGAHFYAQGYSLNRLLTAFSRGNWDYVGGMFRAGAPFAITLLLILGVHEMGHYIAARRHGVDVTLPYFIPMPLLILGTMGAVIFIKSPLTNRKALFDVGISGPLAGFVVALIAFIVGINMPQAGRNLAFLEIFGPGFRGLGMPLLLQWTGAAFAPNVSNLSRYIISQPVALAAWWGMLLTVLNLLPLGQLDGGHVMYTLFGRFAWTIATIAFFGLIFLGLTNPALSSLLFYAVLVFLTGLRHPPPGNDITPLDLKRKILGYSTIVLFFLIATATPFVLQSASPFTF